MSDNLESRLRDELASASLPGAPEELHAYVQSLRVAPVPGRRRPAGAWILLVPLAALLIGLVGLAGGSLSGPAPSPPPSTPAAVATSTPSPSASSVPSFPTTVDGLTVESVSELLAARAAGKAKGGPYALRGYWTNRSTGHSCAAPLGGQTGELELYCRDGEWGITERDEEILHVDIQQQANQTSVRATPATGPHLSPWVPSTADAERLFGLPFVNGQFWPPVPIMVIGHFDDPKAADCRPDARQVCLDRFVIDRIVQFDPDSVPAPPPSPTPTPFPLADPPAPLFTDHQCYEGVPKKLKGWVPFNDLNIQVSGPGYVYAMVTRDVIPIGDWWDNANYPGHQTRWWGQGVCYAVDKGGMGFGAVNGTTFLEVDDGRHIVGTAP
jgi:hypothetical protein